MFVNVYFFFCFIYRFKFFQPIQILRKILPIGRRYLFWFVPQLLHLHLHQINHSIECITRCFAISHVFFLTIAHLISSYSIHCGFWLLGLWIRFHCIALMFIRRCIVCIESYGFMVTSYFHLLLLWKFSHNNHWKFIQHHHHTPSLLHS